MLLHQNVPGKPDYIPNTHFAILTNVLPNPAFTTASVLFAVVDEYCATNCALIVEAGRTDSGFIVCCPIIPSPTMIQDELLGTPFTTTKNSAGPGTDETVSARILGREGVRLAYPI